MKSFEHEPVMIGEILDILNLRPGGIYLDCTLGGAGHAIEAAKRVSPGGMVIGLDVDKDAIEAAESKALRSRLQSQRREGIICGIGQRPLEPRHCRCGCNPFRS